MGLWCLTPQCYSKGNSSVWRKAEETAFSPLLGSQAISVGARGQLGLGSMDTLRSQFESLFNEICVPDSQAVSPDSPVGTRPCLYGLAVLPPSQEATCPWWESPGRQLADRQRHLRAPLHLGTLVSLEA